MGVQIRTQSNITAGMIDALQRRIPNITTQTGSVVREAFINAPAAQMALLYDALNAVQNVQILANAVGEDLDAIGSNYGVARRAPIAAEGSIVLVLEDLASGDDVTVANGSVVSTETTAFSIVGEYEFRAANRSIYRNIALQNAAALEALGVTEVEYAAVIPIRCLTAGAIGNVSVGQINRGSLAGVQTFSNTAPTFGGADIEGDNEYRGRISLAIAGNSVGTEDGLLATALDTPGVIEAVVVGPGDLLMERDGTTRDEDDTIITEGTGLSVDIYVRGSSQQAAIESFTYIDQSVDSDDYGAISSTNDFVLGQTGISNVERFAFQPVTHIISVSGSQSGANFKEGQEVTDDEGNILLEGNYFALKDFEADKYSLVQNVETGEVHVARSLASNSISYVTLEDFEVGLEANSALGRDRLKWISNVVSIDNEVVTRGTEFNGADTLVFSDIDHIEQVVEETLVTRETVVISTDAGFTIFTRHTPVKEIKEIRHSRLGTTYAFELIDSSTGEVSLVGRFPPQFGDILQITYVWEKHYIELIEFALQGDSVDWVESFNELPSQITSVLLPSSLATDVENLPIQPNTPTYLAITLSELIPRSVYTVSVTGDTANYITRENSAYVELREGESDTDNVFVFQVRRPPKDEEKGSQVARVLNAANLTTGVTYNLLDYALRTNQYDRTARVNTALGNNEFGLNVLANTTIIEPGDQIQFSQLAEIQTWTTQNDFLYNIDGNIAPVFDTTRLEATNSGELHLRLREQNDSLIPVEISGSIVANTTWSGMVDIVDDVTIEVGVTVTIEPDTVIRFKESAAFPDSISTEDTFILDNSVSAADPFDEHQYLFESATLTGSFFTIINALGEDYIIFFTDVIRRVRETDGTILFYRNEILIPSAFYDALQEEIDGLGDPDLTAVFIGGFYNTTGLTHALVSVVGGSSYYRVPLLQRPIVTGLTSQDFTVFEDGNETNTVSDISFVNESNLLRLQDVIAQDTYVVRYSIPNTVRLSLNVNGTLIISTSATEDTAPIFASAATIAQNGDWEGIVFNPSSRGAGNVLRHARIKHANVGIRVVDSDPIIDQCIVRDCLTNHIAITGSVTGQTNISAMQLTSTIFDDEGFNRIRQFGISYGFDGYGADNIYGTADDGLGADGIPGTADDGYGADGVPGITLIDAIGFDGYGADDVEGTLDDGYGADGISGEVDEQNLQFAAAEPPDKTITVMPGTYYINDTQYLLLSNLVANFSTLEFFDTPGTYNKVVVSLNASQSVILTYTEANNNADPNAISDPVSPANVVDIVRVVVHNTGSLGAGNIDPITNSALTDIRFYYKIGRDLVVGTADDVTGIGLGYGADDGYGIDGVPGITYAQAPVGSPFYVPSTSTPPGFGYRKGYSDRVVEFKLTGNLVTATGETVRHEKITDEQRSIVHLMWGRDFNVYVDGVLATLSNLTIKALRDFAIEYDDDGYSLAFYNTYDVIELLGTLTGSTGYVTIDYFTSTGANSTITDSLLLNSGVSSIALDKAQVDVTNNTIENPGAYGLEVQNSHGLVRNNLVTNHSTAAIIQDPNSVLCVQHNDMWSLEVESRELLRIVDQDQLSEDINSEVVTFQVLTSEKYASGQVVQVDEELMLVRTVVPGFITVTRGYNRTTPIDHLTNALADIFSTRVTFTITGVPSSQVAIRQTDSNGNFKAGINPVYLRALTNSTYTVSFPVNRRAIFSFVFVFTDERTDIEVRTRVYTLSSVEFERGVNIVYNPSHIISNSDDTNFSTDPSYLDPEYDNLAIDSTSLAHKDNLVFATPYDPRVDTNRFLGVEEVTQTVVLERGNNTIILDYVPVSIISLSTDIVVVGATDPSKVITVIDGSYNTETKTVSIPVVTVATAGTYNVTYSRAVSLGNALNPHYEVGVVSYIFDTEKIVDFTRLLFDRLSGGGVSFRFRAADEVGNLSAATYSNYITVSPSSLLDSGDFVRDRVIEIEVTLKGNDGSIREGQYLYPILQSFTLEITPARDTELYSVLSTGFRQRTGITSVDIELVGSNGEGISSATISAVGSQPVLNVFVLKAGVTATEAFLVARCKALTIGVKTIEVFGDVTVSKEAPLVGDKLAIDYLMADLEDLEALTFIQNGVQLTTERFFNVQQFVVTAERDELSVTLGSEVIGARSTNQPEPDSLYLVDYEFEAPKSNELITVNFGYNALIRNTSLNADANSDVVTNTLVKQVFEVPLNIEANVTISAGADENTVRLNIQDALLTYIEGLLMGVLITLSEISSVMRVSGVIDLTVTRFARDNETGVGAIQLNARESAILNSEDFVTTMFVLGSSSVTGTNT